MGDKIIAVTPDKCFMNIGTEMEMEKNSGAIYFKRSEPSPSYPSVNRVCISQTCWMKNSFVFNRSIRKRNRHVLFPSISREGYCYEAWLNLNKNDVRCGGKLTPSILTLGSLRFAGARECSWKLQRLYNHSLLGQMPAWQVLPLAGKGGGWVLKMFSPSCKENFMEKGKAGDMGVLSGYLSLTIVSVCLH